MGSNPTLSANAQADSGVPMRRDDRVAEGARLESVCTGNRTEGSNPSLSAKTPGGRTFDALRGLSPVHFGAANPARPGREQR